MMESPQGKFIKKVWLKNVLSFGNPYTELNLEKLNVLIGPNGSGKSNLIEVLSLFQSCPTDLRKTLAKGTGVADWIWKGGVDNKAFVGINVVGIAGSEISHRFSFGKVGVSFELGGEILTIKEDDKEKDLFHNTNSGAWLRRQNGKKYNLESEELRKDQSVLQRRLSPDFYPELTALSKYYEEIRIYREWSIGRDSKIRDTQAADLQIDYLEPDFSNLWLYVSKLLLNTATRKKFFKHLGDIYEGVTDLRPQIFAGQISAVLMEGDFEIPVSRLSDGTLRYICLLAILCDPNPSSLICLEEPEIGLHPDLVGKVAELLIEASERTQLIVTTHSEMLVDCLSNHVDSVIVCEKEDGQTQFKRLDAEKMKVWLEDYGLGDLWVSGKLGGVRW